MDAPNTASIGRRGEGLAVDYLRGLGWTIIDRNWHCQGGEVDIIARDPGAGVPTTVFVEVKFRTGRGFGDPLESITWTKARRMRASCAQWLASHHTAGEIRIDAIGIVKSPGMAPVISHLRAVS